ncbi:MAG: DUF167 domain-containing protein [Candidatus Sulfotelmatobacter sp.]
MANAACIEFFAGHLKLPRSSVTIASGQKSRNKSHTGLHFGEKL